MCGMVQTNISLGVYKNGNDRLRSMRSQVCRSCHIVDRGDSAQAVPATMRCRTAINSDESVIHGTHASSRHASFDCLAYNIYAVSNIPTDPRFLSPDHFANNSHLTC